MICLSSIKKIISLIIGILFALSMSSCWLECLDPEETYTAQVTNNTDVELYFATG